MSRLLHRISRRVEEMSHLRFTIYDLRVFRQFARKWYIINRKLLWLLQIVVTLVAVQLTSISAIAEQRFPPPDFTETNHQLPITTTPAARAEWLQYLDVAVLFACLGVAVWLIYRKRSRRGVWALSVFSLIYFGFWRQGCICAIGAPQNIILGLFEPSYTVPLTVIAFFAAPLIVALFAGRAFCAGVCPHGALQDLLLIKPIKVPLWLEHALGVLPFIFLGFGLTFAATGTGFPICRYDPIVPIFRLNGPGLLIFLAALTLVLGMFVGRPYCRFLCPYGALLKLTSLASKWRVRVTPDICTQCQLCENSCPFGAMREPSSGTVEPKFLKADRRNLGWLLLCVPVLIAGGAWVGGELSVSVARLNPTVELAERYINQQKSPANYGVMTPEALSLQRAERDPEALLKAATDLRHRFWLACVVFGGWVGLVIGVKLVSLSLRTLRTDFEPDRGACFACARCFRSCPQELVRIGQMPASELPARNAAQLAAAAK
ncbi:MAG: 4Fe-4S binding protein [Verrucomicrobia bacterium]|nr:4Fe-4S binding protein [Verrucomicrobiota bacterium]